MLRSLLRRLRKLASALGVLAGLYLALEIGLRVYDSYTGQITRPSLYDRGLVYKSWTAHHELKPLLRGAQRSPDGQRVTLVTNSLGLRGPEVRIPKPPGVYRILCLGDETTFGCDVPENQTYPARLRELLQPLTRLHIEVVNAGVPEYCPLLSAIQLRQKLLALQPDLVVLQFDMGDVAEDYRLRRWTAHGAGQVPLTCPHPDLDFRRRARDRKEPATGLLVPGLLKQQLGHCLIERATSPHVRRIDAPTGRYLWLEEQPPDWSPYIQQALAPCAAMRELAVQASADFVVVLHPVAWQAGGGACADPAVREAHGVPLGACYRNRRPFETVAAWCAERKIPCGDLSPAFQSHAAPESLYGRKSANLSAAGQDLYARELFRYLVAQRPGIWRDAPSEAAPAIGPRAGLDPRRRSL